LRGTEARSPSEHAPLWRDRFIAGFPLSARSESREAVGQTFDLGAEHQRSEARDKSDVAGRPLTLSGASSRTIDFGSLGGSWCQLTTSFWCLGFTRQPRVKAIVGSFKPGRSQSSEERFKSTLVFAARQHALRRKRRPQGGNRRRRLWRKPTVSGIGAENDALNVVLGNAAHDGDDRQRPPLAVPDALCKRDAAKSGDGVSASNA
jgi:hypothetical protein